MLHKMRLFPLGTLVLVQLAYIVVEGNGIALGYRRCVALRYGRGNCNTGFDLRLHFHGSPSFGSSDVYGTGNGTLAVKERSCHGGIALAHQPWSVPFIDRDPFQFFRKVSYPKVYVKKIVPILS
jgi:hypothetical protein